MAALFFNYSIDCETPVGTEYTGPERRPFFHGPESWDAAEQSVLGFVSRMAGLGVRDGASLFVYPDVARHQADLYRRLADDGVEVALHMNGLRYSRLRGGSAKWMGEMTYAEQREAIRMGKADVEDMTGCPCLGYRACYGSANDDTFPILEELGFTWASNASGRHRPEFFAEWRGSWSFPHHPHRSSKVLVGDMNLYEIPVTVGLRTCFEGNPDQPLDLRVESSVELVGEKRERLRDVIAEVVAEMAQREAPVRAIIGASHNTNPYGDVTTRQSQTLEWVVRHARELAAEQGLEFVAASFAAIRAEGARVQG